MKGAFKSWFTSFLGWWRSLWYRLRRANRTYISKTQNTLRLICTIRLLLVDTTHKPSLLFCWHFVTHSVFLGVRVTNESVHKKRERDWGKDRPSEWKLGSQVMAHLCACLPFYCRRATRPALWPLIKSRTGLKPRIFIGSRRRWLHSIIITLMHEAGANLVAGDRGTFSLLQSLAAWAKCLHWTGDLYLKW